MAPSDLDTSVRLAAFRFLDEQVRIHGDVLPWSVLKGGFNFDGRRVHLVSPQGIFKPGILDFPLTFMTAAPTERRPRPYDDGFTEDDRIVYRYQGTDPRNPDNVGLRKAKERNLPLIYFHGIVPGRYLTVWPVFIEGEDPSTCSFFARADDRQHMHGYLVDGRWRDVGQDDLIRRRYYATQVRQRLHQGAFRERVLRAYQEQCAICRLKRQELLDAAHIIEDSDPRGEPIVSNGLTLCKLHHKAFDAKLVGITPDYVVQVRQDIMDESDGPMLLYGLQKANDTELWLPTRVEWKPDREALGERYEEFQKAG